MEIPEISMISDFQAAGMKCLQNPPLVSRLSCIEKVPQVYSFWKWGAVILAVLATFSGIIKKIKLFFVHICMVQLKPSSSSSSEPLLQRFYYEEDFSDSEDDGDDECSSIASDDDNADDDHQQRVDEDFCVKGSSLYIKEKWQNGNMRLRRRRTSGGAEKFSWAEFGGGRNVVKLWDGFGLALDFEGPSDESVVSVWDLNEDRSIFSNFLGVDCHFSALPAPSSAVVLTAETGGSNRGVVLGGYDARMRRNTPAMYAKWGPDAAAGNVVEISTGGVEKVYVRDDVKGVLTVGDLRNVKAPLENVTESAGGGGGDRETWWDADAVIVEDEFENSR